MLGRATEAVGGGSGETEGTGVKIGTLSEGRLQYHGDQKDLRTIWGHSSIAPRGSKGSS